MFSKEEYFSMEGFPRVICTNDFEFETEAVQLETGNTFKKNYIVIKGTKGTLFRENNRNMIRLDEPITAVNEDKAPYKSKLYRVFDYILDLRNWSPLI